MPESSESTESSRTSLSTSIPKTPQANAQDQAQPSSGNAVLRFIGSVLTLIFRLGLLTGGAGIALVVGVAIATIRPAEVANEPPLLEIVLQQVDRFRP